MNLEDFLSYIKTIQIDSHILHGQRGSEENVKVKIIMPLLQGLGWDVLCDMQFEYIATDIVLFHQNEPLLIVETKSWGDVITNYLDQCLEYCLKLKTPWIVISTGDDTALYCAWINSENLSATQPVLKFRLNQLTGKDSERIINELSLLSKESFLGNRTELHAIVQKQLGEDSLENAKKCFEEKAASFKRKIKSERLTVDEYRLQASKHSSEDTKEGLEFLRINLTALETLNDNIKVRYRSREIGIEYHSQDQPRHKKIGLFGVYPGDAHIAFGWEGWEELKITNETLLKLKKARGKVQSKKQAEELIDLLKVAIGEIKTGE